MVNRRAFVVGSAAAGAMAVLGAAAPSRAEAAAEGSVSSGAGHVLSVTAITKVFGDGQKLIAVALEYDSDIDGSSLSASTFDVTGRTVTRAYTNRTASLARPGGPGRYVVVELSPDDAMAALWVTGQGSGGGSGGGGVGPGGPTVGDTTPGGTILPATVTLTQAGPVVTARGLRYAPSSATLTSGPVVNLIVDDFRQLSFADPATGQTLNYNLFVPRHYDPGRRYPLVLFMHDASVVNVATVGPLVQGLGAVCWASPEDQDRHECFVVAPEYGAVVIDDNYEPSTLFDATVNLVRSLAGEYGIDRSRLYVTGQSMGAMMSLGMGIRYPGLFAASFIVAGQWPSAQAAPLARQKLWIVVSQDDTKAYPGENAITDVIEQQGTKVAAAVWDAQSTAGEFAADVRGLLAQHAPVNYAAFEAGTVTTAAGGGSAHMDTWRIAYTIPGIRDWIMRQSR